MSLIHFNVNQMRKFACFKDIDSKIRAPPVHKEDHCPVSALQKRLRINYKHAPEEDSATRQLTSESIQNNLQASGFANAGSQLSKVGTGLSYDHFRLSQPKCCSYSRSSGSFHRA